MVELGADVARLQVDNLHERAQPVGGEVPAVGQHVNRNAVAAQLARRVVGQVPDLHPLTHRIATEHQPPAVGRESGAVNDAPLGMIDGKLKLQRSPRRRQRRAGRLAPVAGKRQPLAVRRESGVAVIALLVSQQVAGPVAVRVDEVDLAVDDHGQPSSIGRPGNGASQRAGQPQLCPSSDAGGRNDPQLPRAVAASHEGDSLAIGRPAHAGVDLGHRFVEQLAVGALDQIEHLHVPPGAVENPAAVGRPARRNAVGQSLAPFAVDVLHPHAMPVMKRQLLVVRRPARVDELGQADEPLAVGADDERTLRAAGAAGRVEGDPLAVVRPVGLAVERVALDFDHPPELAAVELHDEDRPRRLGGRRGGPSCRERQQGPHPSAGVPGTTDGAASHEARVHRRSSP